MTTELTEHRLQILLEDAAEKGAIKALHSIGLGDEGAANDMHEVRGLLEAYRTIKKGVFNTIGTAIAGLIIGGVLVWFGINYGK